MSSIFIECMPDNYFLVACFFALMYFLCQSFVCAWCCSFLSGDTGNALPESSMKGMSFLELP